MNRILRFKQLRWFSNLKPLYYKSINIYETKYCLHKHTYDNEDTSLNGYYIFKKINHRESIILYRIHCSIIDNKVQVKHETILSEDYSNLLHQILMTKFENLEIVYLN